MTIKPYLIQYLKYIVNAGNNVTIANFDDDWDPIGPMLRKELIPVYIIEGPDEKLVLTSEGHKELFGA